MRPCSAVAALVGLLAFACGPTSEPDSSETGTSGTGTSGTGTSGTSTSETGASGTTSDAETAAVEPCTCHPASCQNGDAALCAGMWSWCSSGALLTFLDGCSPAGPCAALRGRCADGCGTNCVDQDECVEYDEATLECALYQLRDRTPGDLAWEQTLELEYNRVGRLRILDDGRVFVHDCINGVNGGYYYPPEVVKLAAPAYFDGCLAETSVGARASCMFAGIQSVPGVPACP